jgi:hypothetical protein
MPADRLEGISKGVYALSLVWCCLRDDLKHGPEITGFMVAYCPPHVKKSLPGRLGGAANLVSGQALPCELTGR